MIGQWISGSHNHLQVSGSDNHLQAICARFGLQPESGYEMLRLLLQSPELDSFDSYAWGFLDFPLSGIHLDIQAAAFLESGTFY